MLTVGKDARDVEQRLRRGELRCPSCDDVLAPWGYARQRMVWGLGGGWRVRPRRSACQGCGKTHVLLPVVALWHRRDGVEVFGEVFTRCAAGQGTPAIRATRRRPAGAPGQLGVHHPRPVRLHYRPSSRPGRPHQRPDHNLELRRGEGNVYRIKAIKQTM